MGNLLFDKGPVRISGSQERRSLIGTFFENLTLALIGGRRPQNNILGGDIEHWPLDALIEVKACNSEDDFRIFNDQFDNYLQGLGFPFGHCLYALWVYQNSPRCISNNTPDIAALRAFLAQKTETFSLVDISVLETLRREQQRKRAQQNGRSSCFPRLTINQLRNLDTSNLAVTTFTTRICFTGNAMSFESVLVLEKGDPEKIRKLISANCKKRSRLFAQTRLQFSKNGFYKPIILPIP